MKKGVKRDLLFAGALLGVWVAAAILSWFIAYLLVGPPPANEVARALYAEGIKKLFSALFVIGTLTVVAIYFWRLDWLPSKPLPMKDQSQAGNSGVATGEPRRDEDSSLSPWIGWGILMGFVLIMVALLVFTALSHD